MDDTRVTVYFAGFEPGSTEDKFTDIFSKFGNIEKIFLHKTKNYGMVEFDNNRSCMQAIEALHQKPPLNLHVNMAKNQLNSSLNGNTSASYSKRPQNFNKYNHSSNKQQGENFFEEAVTYDVQDYYLDENNEFVTVFVDEMNEVYVPVRYAPSLRKFSRKVPKKINCYDDERSSVKSDSSERRVQKVQNRNDPVANYTIQRNIDTDNTGYRKNQGSGNLFDNRKQFDKNNGNKKFEQNNTFNRNFAHKDGEHKSSNISRFPKKQNHFENRNQNCANDNNEDWNSPGSSHQSKNDSIRSDLEISTPRNVQVQSKKVEIESATPVKANDIVLRKPVQPATSSTDAAKTSEKFVLKTFELPDNQFTEVHVENAVDETVGWVTLTNKADELESLTLEIYGVIESAPICAPEVGKLVLSLYEDFWFRAIILSTSPDIRVRYIDFGNEQVVTKKDIKEIPVALAKTPAFALRIKLANGAPCKMVNESTFKVKPIQKENNLTIVHVENGIYELTEEEKKPVEKVSEKKVLKDDHPMNIFHQLLISQIDVNNIGYLEIKMSLSKTKFVASFCPSHLTEELLKLQSIDPPVNPSFKPVVGDIVCAKNDEGWQRVYLLKIENDMYKVAFIDFGVVNDVSEVRSLPNQFINVPIFSCVCTAINDDDLRQLNEEVEFKISDVSGSNITCTIQINEKQLKVLCSPWDPRDRECIPLSPIGLQEIALKNGEGVKLEMESNGFLYVINKQGSDIRKKINKYMANNGPRAAVISEKPNVGQLVTAEYSGEFYRAIILNIKNNDVTICYIDYGNEETVPMFSLKVLNEEMKKEPISIIKIRLRHFVNKPFTIEELKYLEELTFKNTVLNATLDGNPEDGYDLKLPNGLSVSQELKKLDSKVPEVKTKPDSKVLEVKTKPDSKILEVKTKPVPTIKVPSDNEPKILISQLSLLDIPLGKTEVVFQQFSDIDVNLLCVCLNDPKILHKVQVEMQNQISKYVNGMLQNLPYEPESEECILVQNAGKWYRGACTSEPENNEYTIFLVDYGSCIQVSSKDIRRMPKEFAEESALCNFAKFDGLPDNPSPSLSNRLKALLERNNSYPVNVVEKDKELEFYIIQFPTIIELLKKEKLV